MTLLLVLLLNGCASKGPINSPNFDNRFTEIISSAENILLYSPTQVRVGTYMEAEIKMIPSYNGVMVLTNHAIRFLHWDAEEKNYRIQVYLPYTDLKQAKYEFNTLISSFVAVRATNGEAFAFMLSDEMIKLTYRFLMMGQAGHLNAQK
ncbi:MAG: hypothetical protein V7629_07175 [Motiliproteus sp.]